MDCILYLILLNFTRKNITKIPNKVLKYICLYDVLCYNIYVPNERGCQP